MVSVFAVMLLLTVTFRIIVRIALTYVVTHTPENVEEST
jgi:hypothetical protein